MYKEIIKKAKKYNKEEILQDFFCICLDYFTFENIEKNFKYDILIEEALVKQIKIKINNINKELNLNLSEYDYRNIADDISCGIFNEVNKQRKWWV